MLKVRDTPTWICVTPISIAHSPVARAAAKAGVSIGDDEDFSPAVIKSSQPQLNSYRDWCPHGNLAALVEAEVSFIALATAAKIPDAFYVALDP